MILIILLFSLVVIPIAYVPQINQSILTESPFPVVIAAVAIFFFVVFIAFVMVHCRYRKQQSSSIASSIGSNHSFRAPSDSSSFNHSKNFPVPTEVPLDPNEMNPVLSKNRRIPQVPYCHPRNGNGLVAPSSPRHQVSGDVRSSLNSQNANIHINQQYPFTSYQHQKGSIIHCSPHHGPIFGNRGGGGMNSTNSPVIPAYSSVPIFTDNELKKVPSSPRHQIRAAQQSYQQSYSEGKGSISSYHSNNRSDGGNYNHHPTNTTHHNGVALPEESAHYDYSTITYGSNFCWKHWCPNKSNNFYSLVMEWTF